MLKFENVAIEYPKRGRVPAFRAAEDINLEIYPGEILGLVGESGSGKTTLGRASVGLLPIKEGKLTVVGYDISDAGNRDLQPLRRKTGIVFQDPGSSLNPRMPIGQSIGEPLLLAEGVKGKELDKRVQELLDLRSSCPRATATATRTSSRAASASASASRGRSPSRPNCSSPTSRRARSTSRCRPDSSTCCRSCRSGCSSPACS